MSNDTKFNVVEGQLVRYFHNRPETAWDGFELWPTGGGFYAYAKKLDGNRYLLVCDNDNQVGGLSDDDFIVGLEDEDGISIAHVLRQIDTNGNSKKTIIEVENYMGGPTLQPSFNPSNLEEALAGFGVLPMEVE